jgi:hypothetical protein
MACQHGKTINTCGNRKATCHSCTAWSDEDHIDVSGDTQEVLKAIAANIQAQIKEWEDLAVDCVHFKHGGCRENIDGCTAPGCPLVKE